MPQTKICTRCGVEKPIEEFGWKSKEKGTYRSECKVCQSKYMKERYKSKKLLVEHIKQKLSCAKCGYNEYGVALDFHHLNPSEKIGTIAHMTSNNYRLDATLQEIDKCICLCANCHRVFHFREKNEGITIQEFLNDADSYNSSTYGLDP